MLLYQCVATKTAHELQLQCPLQLFTMPAGLKPADSTTTSMVTQLHVIPYSLAHVLLVCHLLDSQAATNGATDHVLISCWPDTCWTIACQRMRLTRGLLEKKIRQRLIKPAGLKPADTSTTCMVASFQLLSASVLQLPCWSATCWTFVFLQMR